MKKTIKKAKPNYGKVCSLLIWIPVFLLFAFLPMVVKYVTYTSRLSEFSWVLSEMTNTDWDLYGKQVVLILLSGSMFFLFIIGYVVKQTHLPEEFRFREKSSFLRKQWHILIPIGIYLLLALLSAICSDYKLAAFAGSDDQFESFFAVLAYGIVLCYLFLVISTEKQVLTAAIAVYAGIAILSLTALFQIAGNSPIHWDFLQPLIAPKSYWAENGDVITWADNGQISLFSHNPNYAGVLLALLSSFSFGMILTERKWKQLLWKLLLFLATVAGLVATGSKAGLLVFIAVCFFSLIFLRRKVKKHWYIYLSATVVIILAGVLLFHDSLESGAAKVIHAIKLEKGEENPLTDMETTPEGIQFTYRDISFLVGLDVDMADILSGALTETTFHIFVKNASGGDIPVYSAADGTAYCLDYSGLEDVKIQFGIMNEIVPILTVQLNNHTWSFVKLDGESELYFYLNPYGRAEQLTPVERIGFRGYEHFATNRGLIWSMTLPLLKERILIGSGNNTFAFIYPQNNYKDMYYYLDDTTITTRPHSMYLQIAVETGVLSLIALLVFFGGYLLQSLRIYWSCDFETWSERVGFACFLAVVTYLVCGLTNDSMITVAPVFWGICGIGLAANRRNKEMKHQKDRSQAEKFLLGFCYLFSEISNLSYLFLTNCFTNVDVF